MNETLTLGHNLDFSSCDIWSVFVNPVTYTFVSIITAVNILEPPNASYPPPLCRCHCHLCNLQGYILDVFVSQALTAGITVPLVTAAASTGLQSSQQLLSLTMLLLFRHQCAVSHRLKVVVHPAAVLLNTNNAARSLARIGASSCYHDP